MGLATGRLAGVEGLVRWPHPQRGLIGPDQFIPLAEQTGLIRDVTNWVLETALRQCSAWQRIHPHTQLPVAVNLSMRDLQDPSLPETVEDLLAVHKVCPELLRLEITESVLMADLKLAASILARLRAIGVCIAIDDFGTGYS